MKLLFDTDAGGVIFTTIEKFRIKTSPLKGSALRESGINYPAEDGMMPVKPPPQILKIINDFISPNFSSINTSGFTKAGLLK